jgi:NADPH-dependent glutamate synthase beta subunit-like oxidoreductase
MAKRPYSEPLVAASRTSTTQNRTGSWKYIRPQYRDAVAPCNHACPAGVDVEGYMNLLREGQIDEALQLLLRENPMPAITGRVCHHPCEAGCNRRGFDEAVAVHSVERALGDEALRRPHPAPPPRLHVERVAVAGAGPAGLSCAYHLTRLGYGVTVYDEAAEAGGLLRQGIPAYRLPRPVLDRQIERYASMGIEFRTGIRLEGDDAQAELEGYDAIFYATGAHRGKPMQVDGEDGPGIVAGLEFLKVVNRGGRPDIGRRVAIIGGGNTAMDCARTALRLGAEPVVVYRRTRAEMPAIPQEVDEAIREGVEFVFLAAPSGFRWEDGRLVEMHVTRMELGEPDESGRRRPGPRGGWRLHDPGGHGAHRHRGGRGAGDATGVAAAGVGRDPGGRVGRGWWRCRVRRWGPGRNGAYGGGRHRLRKAGRHGDRSPPPPACGRGTVYGRSGRPPLGWGWTGQHGPLARRRPGP